MEFSLGNDVLKILSESGCFVPDGAIRCVIDIEIDSAVKVYWDTLCTKDQMDAVIPHLLNAKVVNGDSS